MNKPIIYSILFLFLASTAYSQKVFTADGEDAIYKREWSLGAKFHTNAYSFFFEHVWIKDIKRRKLVQAHFFIYFDWRERRTATPYLSHPLSHKYYYGKQNNFYALQLSYGWRTVIANKAKQSGVKLSLSYLGGITLGVLKPYYLRIIDRRENDRIIVTDERYDAERPQRFLDSNPATSRIFGAGSFWKGFDKLSFTPGIHAKVGLNFDFARKSKLITALEVGGQIDVFYKKINTYISDKNKPYILNLYLSFQIGKRI